MKLNLNKKQSNMGINKILIIVFVASLVIAGILFRIFDYNKFTLDLIPTDDKVSNQDSLRVKDLGTIDGIDDIYLSTTPFDVSVYPSDDDNITIKYLGKYRKGDQDYIPDISTSRSGNKLEITHKIKQIGFPFNVTGNFRIELYIPKGYNKNIEVDSSASDFNIRNLNLNKLVLDHSAGDVDVNNCTVKWIDVKSKAGDISYNGGIDQGRVKSTAGDIEFNIKTLNGKLEFEATSGDVDISIDSEVSYDLDARATAGDVSTSKPMYLDINKGSQIRGYYKSDNSGNNIYIKTTAGDIDID